MLGTGDSLCGGKGSDLPRETCLGVQFPQYSAMCYSKRSHRTNVEGLPGESALLHGSDGKPLTLNEMKTNILNGRKKALIVKINTGLQKKCSLSARES